MRENSPQKRREKRGFSAHLHIISYRKIVGHYMEEASLEVTRESLIALSCCEPEKIIESTQPEKPNGQHKAASAVDELRLKLISIASEPPSMNSPPNEF
ncbi:unnamed protein product [Lactuca virosa]|uniref:Uncharacterized protein n=1 Tax=Lactuca virosa TaxID=75947 RepID=A0AAU9NDL9_9ASTR|nr:unnamed protein product [Lactuca virosa]CAH1453105.1 unnamed protein product [Lactuca virosa]